MKQRIILLVTVLLASCQMQQQKGGSSAVTAVPQQEMAETAQMSASDQTRTAENQLQLDNIDDFSRDIINLMLDSHNRWQTLQAELVLHTFGVNPQTLQHTVLIHQPYLARISGTDYQAVLGEDDQARQRIDHDILLLPSTLDEVKALTIYLHPLSAMGVGFAGDYIFPTGLAQRGGRYELVANETLLERAVWVVDWHDARNGNERRNRFWIDKETGLILKSLGYAAGDKFEEFEFISLVLDEPIPDEAFQKDHTINSDIEFLPAPPPTLSLTDYPPDSTPTYIENGDFWLVHTPEGQLFAFAPVSPDYADAVTVDECRFDWVESVGRFVDPCSGDEWDLNGRLNREHSTELWSHRDLDQYAIVIQDGKIFVQFHQFVRGLPVIEPPLAIDSQYGITLTAVTADFSPTTTTLITLVQVNPLWEMDPTAFPPQQALTYVTFPDSLIDDQGRSIPPTSRDGETAVTNPQTGGLQQLMHNHWEAIPADARVVTATMRIELLNLHRLVDLPLDWHSYQTGDVWEADVLLPISHAAVQIRQIEWVETLDDGRARLRFTIINASPEGFRFTCLHLDTTDPWERDCANFDDERIVNIDLQPGDPVVLHLRAWVELRTPYELVLDVSQ